MHSKGWGSLSGELLRIVVLLISHARPVCQARKLLFRTRTTAGWRRFPPGLRGTRIPIQDAGCQVQFARGPLLWRIPGCLP